MDSYQKFIWYCLSGYHPDVHEQQGTKLTKAEAKRELRGLQNIRKFTSDHVLHEKHLQKVETE